MLTIKFHEDAEQELNEAAQYYNERLSNLGAALNPFTAFRTQCTIDLTG